MHRVTARCCFLLVTASCAVLVSPAPADDAVAKAKSETVVVRPTRTISTGSVPIQAVHVLDKKSVLVVAAVVTDFLDAGEKKKPPVEPTRSLPQKHIEWSRWELSSGRKMSNITKEISFPVNGVMIGGDGEWVGVYGTPFDSKTKKIEFGGVTIWDTKSGREVAARRIRGVGILTVAVSPSGKQIALATLSSFDEDDLDGMEAAVQIWQTSKGRIEETLITRKRAAVFSLDFGRNSKRLCASLALFGPDFKKKFDMTRSCVVWRTRDWKEVKRLNFLNEAFFMSPWVRVYKSQLIAFEPGFLGNGAIELWKLGSGVKVREWGVREHPSEPASFSPDGKRFAFKNRAGFRLIRFFWQPREVDEIALLDTQSGSIIARLREPKSVATAFSFTKNGRQIISGSSDGGIRIWKLPLSR